MELAFVDDFVVFWVLNLRFSPVFCPVSGTEPARRNVERRGQRTEMLTEDCALPAPDRASVRRLRAVLFTETAAGATLPDNRQGMKNCSLSWGSLVGAALLAAVPLSFPERDTIR